MNNERYCELWVDKYKPKSMQELCIAPKKVKEVHSWLLQQHQQQLFTTTTTKAIPKLLLLVGSPGIGKSTLIHVLAKYNLHWNVLEWNETTTPTKSPLKSFQDFLSNVKVFGCSTLLVDHNNNIDSGDVEQRQYDEEEATQQKTGSIVLIDEIPNLHTLEATVRFRETLTTYIQKTTTPTVLIYSNVYEGSYRPQDIECIIEPSILYTWMVQIMQIQPVTKSKMKACLRNILKMEEAQNNKKTRGKRRKLQFSNDFYDEFHALSGGDLRHAIMSLQFQVGCSTKHNEIVQPWKQNFEPEEEAERHGQKKQSFFQRDTKLSAFHALGKLLYAKRHTCGSIHSSCTRNNNTTRQRPPLQFIPEEIVEQTDMELNAILCFLEYNCPDFFSDISELSTAMNYFSDAALFSDMKYDQHHDSNYPLGYASSLTGRAVATTNKHPTPNKFRQLQAPSIFEVSRKKREMNRNIQLLCNRLSRCNHLPIEANIGSSSSGRGSSSLFAAYDLPFVKHIVPNEMTNSFYNVSSKSTQDNSIHDFNEDIRLSDWNEQMEILANDDIIDDSSCDSDIKQPQLIQSEQKQPQDHTILKTSNPKNEYVSFTAKDHDITVTMRDNRKIPHLGEEVKRKPQCGKIILLS